MQLRSKIFLGDCKKPLTESVLFCSEYLCICVFLYFHLCICVFLVFPLVYLCICKAKYWSAIVKSLSPSRSCSTRHSQNICLRTDKYMTTRNVSLENTGFENTKMYITNTFVFVLYFSYEFVF